MIAIPLKKVGTEYEQCEPEEATHLRFKISTRLATALPVQIKGTREGTPNWTWNGDVAKPTLKPSIKAEYFDWDAKEMRICHVWLNDGMVQHLADCTCGKAGITEPLEEIDGPE